MSTKPPAGKEIICHPLVLLSITDHHSRTLKSSAASSNKRVVGVLLGQDQGGFVNVANSFAVPFEEDDKDEHTWFLDHNYIASMADMFKKVNAREVPVGWYHTGPKLRSSDLEINEVIKRFCNKPIMLICDVRGTKGGQPVDGYEAVEEIKDDGSASSYTFHHLPSSIKAEEAEEIGVEHLLRDITSLSSHSNPSLSSLVHLRLSSLHGFRSRLLEISDYLEQVLLGKMEMNIEIGYLLQDIFNLLPGLEAVEEQGSGMPVAVKTNDSLLVVYLSSLIRAVIALHNLINNKATRDT
ncbi:Mov34-domain-containing protein [Atractiella rhizophila]|nr:Mov34-domain-containing protein [Atractiella rhizophila]KAH8928206.1 Mov34-domain-containing protein [Atractiella rhizophila]